jgi:hypothetical protein
MTADNEFSDAFSSAFDALVSDYPSPLDICWPVNWDACPTDLDPTPEVRAIAEAFAAQTLRMLTGYRVGGCSVTVRPCNRSCLPGTWLTAPDIGALFAGANGGYFGMSPYVGPTGAWMNACGCAGDGCSCTRVQEVLLPTTVGVGKIDSVIVDGVTLPSSAYRVDNHNRLVRQDGGTWPICQDMNLPLGEEDTWSVTYLDGNPVDGIGAFVAGLLAAEYVKACAGADCALPPNVQTITRQGITMQLDPEMFTGGATGVRAVDDYIRIWNPTTSLPSGIYSLDAPKGRRVTRSGL